MKKQIIFSTLVIALIVPAFALALATDSDSTTRETIRTNSTPSPTPTTIPNTTDSNKLKPTIVRASTLNSKKIKEEMDTSLKEYKEANEANKIAKLKIFGQKAIETRINALTNIISQVEANKKLNAKVKTQMTNDINEKIVQLNSLGAEIEAATDIKTLKELVSKIYKEYKIYSVVKPKQIAILTVAKTTGVQKRLESLEKRVSKLVTKLEDQGKDTSAIDAYLTDFNLKMEVAKVNIEKARESFGAITASDPESAKKLNDEGKAYLTIAKENLKLAGTSLKEAIKKIKKQLNGTGEGENPNPTPNNEDSTPTLSPIPAPENNTPKITPVP